ncbi:MAG: hypothetical protein HY695_05140 [Deltaproteobacteria bacterium]|nr:hypothetical protein [Deltaproteobacteria bacterium]
MSGDTSSALLRDSLAELDQARLHLSFSYQRVRNLSAKREDWLPEDLEKIEAYTSRFARLVDLLTNKALRAVFRYELEPAETVLDRLNLAEKRGFVDRAEVLRVLKENRNVIAHDYAGVAVEEIFSFCRSQQAQLDSICDLVAVYAHKLLASSS